MNGEYAKINDTTLKLIEFYKEYLENKNMSKICKFVADTEYLIYQRKKDMPPKIDITISYDKKIDFEIITARFIHIYLNSNC